ncbi:MAG: endonuclease/exonuclease/phosphatase family protein, partial [Myxococcales bacterium]|nr:endonuclease/exonuclease/phosphatase family protein [Myxococcales bacterium]
MSDSDGVRILSLNTWLVPFASEDRLRRRDEMVEAFRTMDPDVICLQEVWLLPDAVELTDQLSDQLGHRVIGGGGLVLISRYPIDSWQFTPFDASGSYLAESLAEKGVLDVTLMTPVGPLRVFNSHLVFERGSTSSAHDAQLRQLIELVGQADETPTVLCADLNMASL